MTLRYDPTMPLTAASVADLLLNPTTQAEWLLWHTDPQAFGWLAVWVAAIVDRTPHGLSLKQLGRLAVALRRMFEAGGHPTARVHRAGMVVIGRRTWVGCRCIICTAGSWGPDIERVMHEARYLAGV